MNIEEGIDVFQATPGAVLIDLRDEPDYAAFHFPGAVRVDVEALRDVIRRRATFRTPIFLYCYSGKRSLQAELMLKAKGYGTVYNLGGVDLWLRDHNTVRVIRQRNNMTQKEFADAAGLSTVSISGFESGRLQIGKKAADKIYEAFGVHPVAQPEAKDLPEIPESDEEPGMKESFPAGTAIRDLRERVGLSQVAFGETIGIRGVTVSSLETGRLGVSKKIADEIQRVYGVKVTLPPKKREAKKSQKQSRKENTDRQKRKAAGNADTASAQNAPAGVPAERIKAAGMPNVHIQSMMGGEITVEQILARVGEADDVYIRVEENRAYWVRGEDSGWIELWQ